MTWREKNLHVRPEEEEEEKGWRKSLCPDKEQMKKANIPSRMYLPSSGLSGHIVSGGTSRDHKLEIKRNEKLY